jgi:hypothetical protein
MGAKLFKSVVVALVAAVWLTAGAPAVLAMDSNGRYFALGAGSRPCSDFIRFREKRIEKFTPDQYDVADVIVEHWVAGFMTAHNFYVTDTFDVVGTVTIDQIEDRIEKYCRANPNRRVAEAVAAIAQDLHASRIKLDTGKEGQEKSSGK